MWTEKERKEEEIEKVNDNQSNKIKSLQTAISMSLQRWKACKLSSRNDPGEILSKSLKKMSDMTY